MATLYEYYNTGDDNYTAFAGLYLRAQTFTPSTAHKITSVKLKLFRIDYPGTVYVYIQPTYANGHPYPTVLCSGTTNGNTLTTSGLGEWREITLGAGYDLEADTKYAIVVRAPNGDAENHPGWRTDFSSPTYAKGNHEYSTDNGSSWTSYTGYDSMFEEWGDPLVVAPTVTTQACTNVQATTARLNGQISNDGGGACQYRFRYKKGAGGAYSYTTWTGAKTTGQTFYEDISGLDKKSLYYFNAQAKNSAGESAWGSELSFTTLATTPVVTTQAVSNIGATTATGHGNITDIGGENCSKRGVCWNTTGNPTVADSKSEETDSFGTGAFTRPMTGLSPATHYYVRAYAYNSAGYGYGDQVEFTTKSYYATGYIGDVIDCTELVKTYDRLEWTEEIPSPEQDIEIKIRSSPDESTWTDWKVIYSSPCTSFITPVQRYLEWVATLTNVQGTPKLKDLGFFWTKKVE